MLSRCLPAVLLAAALLPVRAHADPVTLTAHAIGGGATVTLPPAIPSRAPARIGSITHPQAQSAVAISVRGLVPRSDYLMELIVHGSDSSWTAVDGQGSGHSNAGGGGGGGAVVKAFQSGVADAFSTSGAEEGDGQSFTNAGLERSAAFAGGSATVTFNENSNAAEVLLVSGLAGAPAVRILFGLRDFVGGRSFLVTFSAAGAALGGDNAVSSTPEPASMLLIGTGLAGLAAVRRRRSAKTDALGN